MKRRRLTAAAGFAMLTLGAWAGPVSGQGSQRPAAEAAGPDATVTPETAAAVVEALEQRWRIERDGRATRTTTGRVRVREAAALPALSHLYVGYVPSIETVTRVSVTVEKAEGPPVEVDAAALEDVPTPESGTFDAPTFSDARVKQVAVPALAVGDTLTYVVVVSQHTPLAEGHFWTAHSVTRTAIVLEERLEIDWADGLPLSIRASGTGLVEQPVQPAPGRRVRRWTHRQSTLSGQDTGALAAALSAAKRGRGPLPDVQVSTFESWEQVARWYAGLNAGAEAPAAAIREKAQSLTQGSETAEAQLAALHKFVAQQVRYVSLAFGDGRYRARRAELVLTTGYGDCKDKHALLASLARHLGFTVEPLLINSGRLIDESLPSPGQFDHVVSRVTGRGLAPTWIDATVAMALPGTLLAPLRGKAGLLAGASPQLLETPRVPVEPQHVRVAIAGTYLPDGRYRATVRRQFAGDHAVVARTMMAGADQQMRRRTAEAQARQDGYSDQPSILRVTAADPADLHSPFWWEYELEKTYASPYRAAAYTFWIPTPELELPEADDDVDVPVELGPPGTYQVTARFELPSTLGITPPVPVSVDNDVARYVSTYSAANGVLEIERLLTTKVDAAPPALRGAYGALRRAARDDSRQKFAVAAASAEALSALTADKDPAAAGHDALVAGDLSRSVELLQKAVAMEPTHASAWNSLGRALHGQGRWAEAIEAYDRQIALDAFEPYAYNNRGLSEWSLGKHEAAEASFRKQIEVAPLDKWAHKNLADLLLQRGRFAEARAAYLRAVSITPDDAWAHIGLGRAMIGAGEREQAVSRFEAAVQASATPPVWNDVAWRLAESEQALDKALEYARAAVAAASAGTSALSLDKPMPAQLRMMSSLAAYWDTLGWVLVKRGQVEEAARFLTASWQIRQDGEVAEHLGLVYERLGRRREARDVYRLSVARGDVPAAVRTRLAALGGAETPEAAIGPGGARAPADPRIVPLGAVAGPRTAAEVWLLADAQGTITAARPVVPSDKAASQLAGRLVGRRLRLDAPDATPFTVAARAAVACTAAPVDCSLVVFHPADAMRGAAAGSTP